MHVEIVKTEKGQELVIRMPMPGLQPSKTGKTLVVASSHGNKVMTDVLVDGKPVTVGVNAYVHK